MQASSILINLNNDHVRKSLPWSKLIAAIEEAVCLCVIQAPQRCSYRLASADGAAGNLLIMPAWQDDEVIGMKTVTVWPDNDARGLPSHGANYLVMAARTGELQAVLDGEELTSRRTAAISVIAAKRLMRADARRLLIVGAGPVAENIAEAFTAIYDFATVEIHARRPERAADVVRRLAGKGVEAAVCTDLQAGAGRADVISLATSAREAVLKGEWITAGTHIDMVGSFTPDMRETDDALISRATSIWVDTVAALDESGDLTQPLASGILDRSAVCGDLAALLASQSTRDAAAITVFKAVGFALPDLAAARCALESVEEPLSLIA